MPDIDPVVALLRMSPLTSEQRRAASEAFTNANSEDELYDRLAQTGIASSAAGKKVANALLDLKASNPVQQETIAPPEQASALSRLGSGMAQGVADTARGLYGLVTTNPITTVKNAVGAQVDEYRKAKQAESEGRTSEMVGHAAAAAIPGAGPLMASIGEQIGSGDIAGGIGRGIVMAAPAVAGRALGIKANPEKADYLRRQAEDTVARKVLAPANPNYRVPAQKIAPELLKRGVQGDRIQLQQYADELIGQGQQAFDDAVAAKPGASVPVPPVVHRLNQTLDKMKIGGDVNPVLADAYASLSELRDYVQSRGQSLSVEDMRLMRQQFDDVAAKAGAFSKSSGDLKLSAAADAARDVGNEIRQEFAKAMPELVQPNADMHLGITLRDILDPAKGRPSTPSVTTGATGGLHTTGAIIGSAASNIPGLKALAAFVASDLIPRIKNAKVSPQNQLRLARDQYRLSESLRAGKITPARSAIRSMSLYVPGLANIGTIDTEEPK